MDFARESWRAREQQDELEQAYRRLRATPVPSILGRNFGRLTTNQPTDFRQGARPWDLETARQGGVHVDRPSEVRRLTVPGSRLDWSIPAGALGAMSRAVTYSPLGWGSDMLSMLPWTPKNEEIPLSSGWQYEKLKDRMRGVGGPLAAMADSPEFELGATATDIGGMVGALPALPGMIRGMGRAVPGIKRALGEVVERAAQGDLEGPLGAVLSPLAAARLNVVRDPGGQFSRRRLDPMLRDLEARAPDAVERQLMELGGVRGPAQEAEALNQWVNAQLARYITRDMGSINDPILQMAMRGEPIHVPFAGRALPSLFGETRRRQEMFNPELVDQLEGNPTARSWALLSDNALDPTTANLERLHLMGGSLPRGRTIPPEYQYLEKLDPKTPMWGMSAFTDLRDLGFDHVVDVLRERLASGELDPKRLNRVSVPDAVRMTADYDAAMAKKMGEAAAKREAAMPILKEYPVEGQERGWRWAELNQPGAFADESDRMGHSVRGYEPPRDSPEWLKESGNSGSLDYGHGGWEAIKSGRARVLSLRGPDGKSYATVEISREKPFDPQRGTGLSARQAEFLRASHPGLLDKYAEHFETTGEHSMEYAKKFWPWLKGAHPDIYKELTEPSTSRITQIKGPQNAAPDPAALPYVQDLVRNLGPWDKRIGDLRNTGLYQVHPGQRLPGFSKEIPPGYYSLEDFQKMAAENEMPADILETWMRKLKGERLGDYDRERYAEGGSVQPQRLDLDAFMSEFNPQPDRPSLNLEAFVNDFNGVAA